MNDDELHDDEWIDPLHYRSVTYAAKQWHINFAQAWFKIDQAVKEKTLNIYISAIEFKIYISVTARASWIDSLDDRAVTYAAEQWHVSQAEAWARIDRVVKAEALSRYLPVNEFKEYVQLPAKLPIITIPSVNTTPSPGLPSPPIKHTLGDYFSMAGAGAAYVITGIIFIAWIYVFYFSQSSVEYTGPCASVAPEDRGECVDEYYAHPTYDPYENARATAQRSMTEDASPYNACDENGCPWDNAGSGATAIDSACPYGCAVPPAGCNIKGNISFNSGEKIYHLPGQAYYYDTTIDPAYGERWFCSEAEAQSNGWRKAYQ